jgi:hypothetical protein
MTLAYWRERLPARLFVPAAAALTLAARAGAAADLRGAAGDIGFSLMLLAQFRLWDDLADRARDRIEHPARVLVTTDATPFIASCVWLAALNLCVAAWRGGALAACLLAALDSAAAIWYSIRPSRRTAGGDLLLLGKYPLFVLLLATPFSLSGHTIAGAALVYVAACVFEIWHDSASPMRLRNS